MTTELPRPDRVSAIGICEHDAIWTRSRAALDRRCSVGLGPARMCWQHGGHGPIWFTGVDSAMTVRRVEVPLPRWVAVAQRHRDDGPVPALLAEEATLVHPRAIDARRDELRLGRAAARAALETLGRPPAPILRGPHREPLWPDGIVGSITHADGLAVAALAEQHRCAGIGIDLEHRDRFFPELVQHVAFADEREWLASLTDRARADSAVALFSAKEAIFKAVFPIVGVWFGFEAARLRSVEGGFEGEVVAGSVPGLPRVAGLEVHSRRHESLIISAVSVSERQIVP